MVGLQDGTAEKIVTPETSGEVDSDDLEWVARLEHESKNQGKKEDWTWHAHAEPAEPASLVEQKRETARDMVHEQMQSWVLWIVREQGKGDKPTLSRRG